MIPTSPQLDEFFRQASFYRYHEKFDDYERLYKIRLANRFLESQQRLKSHLSEALRLFRSALTSKDDNIIDWRDQDRILKWMKSSPEEIGKRLENLWEDTNKEQRFASFCHVLRLIGITQTGGQLAVTSTLLMTLSPFELPPVKTDSFNSAMKLAGWPGFTRKQTAAERYQQALVFLDAIIKSSKDYGVELRDRLDAQGVVWCISGGWPRLPVPVDWVNDPVQRMRLQQMVYASEMSELDAESGGNDLTATEKLTLVQARRGQGVFREKVVEFWNCCAVTSCGDLNFLRASHIKPWKLSDNRERLDPYNGLLLSPNLDVAFDHGLITFDDEGRCQLSAQLSSTDRKLLGIHKRLRLRKISPEHKLYLQYHRENLFKKK
ncbi:MAG TPA: HNH endonuclease [Pyrinomonadaceae bacterium]|nr:HNH endonuclease [Pyrinomonadaceae bacterium]